MSDLMFCNIAWMKFYQGVEPKRPYSGAQWEGNEDPREFAELWNFASHEDGYYGYVATPPHWHINVESLGAAQGADRVDGVTVVWVAPRPEMTRRIVGWYDNATVYRDYRSRPGDLPKEYIATAHRRDCVLLPEDERTFEVAKPFRTIWFARDAADFVDSVRDYIEGH